MDLKVYHKIICMDEKEHRPMVEINDQLRLKVNVDYWNIVDEPMVSSQISLPLCYKKVKTLVEEVSKTCN